MVLSFKTIKTMLIRVTHKEAKKENREKEKGKIWL